MNILQTICSKSVLKWGLGGVALIALSSFTLPKYFVWNASSSIPKGLYLVLPDDNIRPGQIALIQPTPYLAQWMDERSYLPVGVPLLKHVAATKGTRVCRTGNVISIRARPVAAAKNVDRIGRLLPVWQGCIIVGKDQLFLLNDDRVDSLDGRYFGTLPAKNMLGRAVAIWTDDDA